MHDGERRQILGRHRSTLRQRKRPHADELVNGAIAGNERPVLNRDMPRQQRAVSKDYVIADKAVVRHMAMLHEKTARTNHGVFLQFI